MALNPQFDWYSTAIYFSRGGALIPREEYIMRIAYGENH